MNNAVLVIIIVLMLGSASYKIYKDKKNNVKCSGCPSYNAGKCSLNNKDS